MPEVVHMLYLAEDTDQDRHPEESWEDIYVLCGSGDQAREEAERIVRGGRSDNLSDITCPDCRALVLEAMED